MNNNLPNRQKGFSLIEIMVVLVIIGLLASIVAPNVIDNLEDSRVDKARADFSQIETALKMYKLDNFIYPTTEQGLEALVYPPESDPLPKNWKKGGYLPKLPKDPWGEVYQYESPSDSHPYDIYSYGADSLPDGEDAAADISIWDGTEELN